MARHRMRGRLYEWDEPHPHAGRSSAGVVAQEAQDVLPLCVTRDPHTGMHSVNYSVIIPYLIESIKTLKDRCDALQAELRENKRHRHR